MECRYEEVEISNRFNSLFTDICHLEGKEMSSSDQSSSVRGKSDNDDALKKMEECIEDIKAFKRKSNQEKSIIQFYRNFCIPAHGIGFSYERIFAPVLDETVIHIDIQEPHIRKDFQLWNFVRFCAVIRQNCPNLELITLRTIKDAP